MSKLRNVNILSQSLLSSPEEIISSVARSELQTSFVDQSRTEIENILDGEDKRLLVIVGPCSIHDRESALEYAQKLAKLREEVNDKLMVVMRVYFEKPRTTVGWKGYINDPYLNDSFRIDEGLRLARSLMLELLELGLPIGSEALDPVTPQYLSDLVSWSAIGARTTESQTHREMASGLSSPVGIKNGTGGGLDIAINALKSVSQPHHFLGVNREGRCAIFETRGNKYGHIVLRGGKTPNYDAESIKHARETLKAAGLNETIFVDCSHGNSKKDYRNQPEVFRSVLAQRVSGDDSIVGVMLESHLKEGSQSLSDNLEYGVSITDSCISWESTEELIREAAAAL